MDKIELGDTVRCKYTGFKGVAVARTEYLNGCIQYQVAPKWDGKTNLREEIGIDENSLEIVKKKITKKKKDSNGGAMSFGITRRGY